jgi:hypothetical protein
MDPQIRVWIHTKMSWIRNSAGTHTIDNLADTSIFSKNLA